MDAEWRTKTDELAAQFLTDEWLFKRRRRKGGRQVKIRAGVELRHRVHKAPGGLIRATAEVTDGTLTNVSLSGDFFFFPEAKLAALEERLDGVAEAELEAVIARFYEDEGIESPGVTPGDFRQVLG